MSQEPDNLQIAPSEFHFKNGDAFAALKESVTPLFWTPVKDLFWQNKKHFIKPAVMLLAGPCVIMAGFYFGSVGLGDGVQDFLAVAARYLFCFTLGTLGGTVLIVWSIADWLVKLTAFSRSYINGETLEQSLDYLKTRKGLLFVSWFLYSIFMTPFIIFLVVSGVLSMMQYLPQPLMLPDYADTIINIATAVGAVFTAMYALLLIPVTGISNGKGSSAAFAALAGTFKLFVPLVIYSILANIIFCLTMELVVTVTFFRCMFQAYVPSMWDQVTIIFSSSILRGVASFFVLPFLIALPAEITKRAVKN